MILRNDDAIITGAIEKLREKNQKEAAKDRKATAIYSAVLKTLEDFCYQDVRFAEAIMKSAGTLGACCEEIAKGSGNSISDIEVYRKAVKYYFPNAKIEFQMKLVLDQEQNFQEETKAAVVLNLFDML